MSDNRGQSDPFANPSSYPGAGKRARRPEPEQAAPFESAPAVEPVTAQEPAAWGEDPRPVAGDGLSDEKAFWSDIFTQSGQDPELTATGSFATLTSQQIEETPATGPRVPVQRATDVGAQTYDPFAPTDPLADPLADQPAGDGQDDTFEPLPPITPDWEGLAEYTVEVPVVTVDPAVQALHGTTPREHATQEQATQEQAAPAQAPRAAHDPVVGEPAPGDETWSVFDDGADPAAQHPEGATIQDETLAEDAEPSTGVGFGGFGGTPPHEIDDEEGPGRRSRTGCLVLLVVLALLGAGLYFAVDRGLDWVKDSFSSTEDYPGPGKGEVSFEVKAGRGGQIGPDLKAAGVVQSVQAWNEAATAAGEGATNKIQPGTYTLRKEMKAADVVALLADPANRGVNRVTIPEGLRVTDIVDTLSQKTDLSKADLKKALKNGKALGLPDFAQGNAEGFLFPATYEVTPRETAASMLKKMVDRWHQAARTWDLESRAATMDVTPYELMTIASLIQAEGRGKDMNKISRVIYNRLDNPTGPTAGFLGIDASQNYGLNRRGTVELTAAELAKDTPYNLRQRKGLPPTPINNMGDDAIDAATHPAEGDWEWYVTVNLDTGETKFTRSPDTFNQYKAEYKAWCNDHPGRCS